MHTWVLGVLRADATFNLLPESVDYLSRLFPNRVGVSVLPDDLLNYRAGGQGPGLTTLVDGWWYMVDGEGPKTFWTTGLWSRSSLTTSWTTGLVAKVLYNDFLNHRPCGQGPIWWLPELQNCWLKSYLTTSWITGLVVKAVPDYLLDQETCWSGSYLTASWTC